MLKIERRRLVVERETLRALTLVERRGRASRSSDCGACSCEQHCEQVRE